MALKVLPKTLKITRDALKELSNTLKMPRDSLKVLLDIFNLRMCMKLSTHKC
jgi:hypothetical protein